MNAKQFGLGYILVICVILYGCLIAENLSGLSNQWSENFALSPYGTVANHLSLNAETAHLLSSKRNRQVDGIVAKSAQPMSSSTPQLREREVEELHLSPGMQVRINAPEAKSYFLVYVPSDYTPARPWPAIFCYHGYSGSATT